MMALQKALLLARAAGRMTPRMALFMLRRAARNRLAPRLAQPYRNRIARLQKSLPLLSAAPTAPGPGAATAAAFYCADYRAMLPDLARGIVTINGERVDFRDPDHIDWAHWTQAEGDHQMWRVKLAHMGFLCPLLAEGGGTQHQLAARLTRHAMQHTDMAGRGAFKGFWFPYAASHRVLALGAGLVMARAKGEIAAKPQAELAEFLRLNAAFVLDNLEHELGNNHLERNLAALCLYFSYAETVPLRMAARLEQWVTQLVAATVLPDGTQVERSPMYQGLSVISLAVMADTSFLSEPLRALLRDRAHAARAAFALLCHPDGQVALFNDAWHDEVPPLADPPAPDGRSILPQGGFGRLSQGGDMCLMDAGPLGPDWNPGHGHADFLSLEISLGGVRLIVDPGTSRYNTGPHRTRERSAAAHNGPIWTGHEPVRFFGSFKVANLAGAAFLDPALLPAGTLAGQFRSGPGRVARAVRHWPGQGWLVADRWTGQGPGQVCWLIPADWQVTPHDKGFVLHYVTGQKAVLAVLAGTAPAEPAAAVCARRYGKLDPVHEILLHPDADQTLLTWIGHGDPPACALQQGADLLSIICPTNPRK